MLSALHSGPVAAVLRLLGLGALWVSLHVALDWHGRGDDLSSVYFAGRLIAEGQQEHVYSHHPTKFHVVGDPAWYPVARAGSYQGFPHPYLQIPLWAKLISPVAQATTYAVFNRLFLILNLSCVFGLIVMAARMWCPPCLEFRALILVLAAISLSLPLVSMRQLNQTQPIFLCAVLAAVWLTHRQRWVAAGFLLALAAAVKITPAAIAVYWLVTGRWRSAVAFAVSICGLLAVSILSTGLSLHGDYWAALTRVSGSAVVALNNQSVTAWLAGLGADPREYRDWTMLPLPAWIRAVNYLGGAACLGLLWWRFRRSRLPAAEYDRFGVPFVLIASTIFAPLAWNHYYIVLVVPVLVLLERTLAERNLRLGLLIALIFLLNTLPLAPSLDHQGLAEISLLRSHLLAAGVILLALWFRGTAAAPKEPAGAGTNRTG